MVTRRANRCWPTPRPPSTVAVDNILGYSREIDYRSIPAATLTHPEISLGRAKSMRTAAQEGFDLFGAQLFQGQFRTG